MIWRRRFIFFREFHDDEDVETQIGGLILDMVALELETLNFTGL
jgi:hypothetical protein